LRADEEIDKVMAPADVETEKDGKLVGHSGKVMGRVNGEFQFVDYDKVEYVDVSPAQIVGVSAALIPFLEHDDANRALMGSNMQRQAVPLLKPQSPIVGTGLEHKAAVDSRMLINAEGHGVVEYVDADEIVINYE